MSTVTRNKRMAARQKITRQQAAQRALRRRRMLLFGGSIATVLAIVLSVVLVKVLGTPPAARSDSGVGAVLPTSVAANVSSVPATTLNAVGTGATFPGTVTPATGVPLTAGEKPEILYIGAEYCPYCATERWPMAVALSRFGAFSGLRGIHSSPTDVYAFDERCRGRVHVT